MQGAGRRLAGLALVILASAACSRSDPDPGVTVRPGHALAPTTSDSLASVELPPGQEVVELDSGLANSSDESLEITKLRPVETTGIPDAGGIVRVALVHPSSVDVAGGLFVTFPPVTRRDGRCVRAKVFPARGATLQPEQQALILVWIRAVAEGRVAVPAFNVTYEQDDDLFEQTIRVDGATTFNVRNDATALKPSADERACASKVRLLPGAVHV